MRISDWSSDVCSSDLGKIKSSRLPPLLQGPRVAAQGQLGGASAHAAATSASFARSSSRQSGSSAGRLAGSRQCIGSVRTAAAYHRSEEHTSELQSLMRISYAVFCLKKKKNREHNVLHEQDKKSASNQYIKN